MTLVDPHAPALSIADDLAWLDATLLRAIEARRAQAPRALPGVYLSESEVDALLARPSFVSRAEPLPDRWFSQRLNQLAGRCGLQPFDQAALLMAAAVAIDQRYARLCAYLQDDLTRAYPTPALALELFAGDFESRARLRARFAADSPLRALQIVRLGGDDSEPLTARPMTTDERTVSYLLESDALPQAEAASRPGLILSNGGWEALGRLRQEWVSGAPAAVFVAGEAGSGRRMVARHLADAAGTDLVVSSGTPSAVDAREAALRDAMLCLARAGGLFQPDEAAARREVEAALVHTRVPVVATIESAGLAPGRFAGREVRLFVLPPAGIDENAAIWQQEAGLAGVALDQEQARLLASTYRLSGASIAAAVECASLDDGRLMAPLERLIAAAKSVSSSNLGRLGQEVAPRFGWDDIVLPDEVADVLREIILRVRHRGLVFGEWGFTARHARSRSLTALFAGPSGTGKTMAAEVIANELALPLYRVDLAAVVSKYIGETEKNLAQIFDEASSSSAVLFFDEADALFGRRSEVRDSHDRYANIEVSYLLQRMEDYDGIVILASNFRQNLDEAFIRRLHLTADFPFPDEASRLEIWRRTLPASLPLAPDVDLAALARRFRLSGGNIRNVCVTAAFLAADAATSASMGHFLRAIRREHQKMGKLLLHEEAS